MGNQQCHTYVTRSKRILKKYNRNNRFSNHTIETIE